MNNLTYFVFSISIWLYVSAVSANESTGSVKGDDHRAPETHEIADGHGHDEDNHAHDESAESHEAADEHGDEDDEDDHHAHGEESIETRIDTDIAKTVDIKTAFVSSRQINQQISSYGNLTTSPEQLSHVTARFPGLISSVSVNIGDRVSKGTLLAQVESNDSLLKYEINSPIDGMVIQRHANTGEFVSDQVLFSIANFDTLWAELRIYPTHRSQVSTGQHVEISINQQTVESKIAHVIPVVNQPYQLARVKIDNNKLGLSPGMLIEGNIVIDQFVAGIAIENDAIQIMEGEDGVFIHTGERYTFSPLVLGRSDAHFTEVVSGIADGQEYVTKNSYLIKADIEKSEAEHEH